jgi:hypothetical protein
VRYLADRGDASLACGGMVKMPDLGGIDSLASGIGATMMRRVHCLSCLAENHERQPDGMGAVACAEVM